MSQEEAVALLITGLIFIITVAIALVLANSKNAKKDIVSTSSNAGLKTVGQDKKAKKKTEKHYSSEQTSNLDLTTEIINSTAINSAMDDSSNSVDYGTMSDYGSGGDFGTYG